MKGWYLIYCKPRSESRAQHNLSQQQIETYLPMMADVKVVRGEKKLLSMPLFPNYLFIYFDPIITSVKAIHSTRGVNRIVNCQEKMKPIDDSLIEHIRLNELKAGTPTLVEDIDLLKEGDKIRFTTGPFADLEGVFHEKCPNKRCQVLFHIMGQLKTVTVPVENIARAVCQ